MAAYSSGILFQTGTDTHIRPSDEEAGRIRAASMGAMHINILPLLMTGVLGMTPLVMPVQVDVATGETKTSIGQLIPFDAVIEGASVGCETEGGSATSCILEYDEDNDGNYTTISAAAVDLNGVAGKAMSLTIDSTKLTILGGSRIRGSITATGGTTTGGLFVVWIRRL